MQISEATVEQLQSALQYLGKRLESSYSHAMKATIKRDMRLVQSELDSRNVAA